MTFEEAFRLSIARYDAAVARMRAFLADPEQFNDVTREVRDAIVEMESATAAIWALKLTWKQTAELGRRFKS